MGFFVLIILTCIIIAAAVFSSDGTVSDSDADSGLKRGRGNSSKDVNTVRSFYDEESYEDYETSAARGVRDYFSEDTARDYDSYFAQVADAAEMGDQDAIEEMRGEFGDGEW